LTKHKAYALMLRMNTHQPSPDSGHEGMQFSDEVLASSLALRLDAFKPMNLVTGEAGQQVFFPMDVARNEGGRGDTILMQGRMVSPDTVQEFNEMNLPVPADAGSPAEVVGFIPRHGRVRQAIGRLTNRATVDPMVSVQIRVGVEGIKQQHQR
jgi:hypothetical protein